MIKLRVSFKSQKEYDKIIELLHPVVEGRTVKIKDEGDYKKAYIIIKNV